MLSTILWIILAIVLIGWLFGLIGGLGNVIWILLVIAVIILVFNLLATPRYRV